MRKICASIILISIILSTTIYAADRVSLGFIYTSDASVAVNKTNDSVNQVSPIYFEINSKGKLEISNIDESFIEEMHQKEIKIIPLLTNHWNRARARKFLKNTDEVIDEIIETLEQYNLDGINVDLENLTEKDKESLTEFVKKLNEKLSETKELVVSVAANPYEMEKGWQGSYDYEELGNVSDYLFVMTYDEHSQGGGKGAVASIDFVRQSIEYTLKYVSKDKVVIGIPLYGRFWREGADVGGEAVVLADMPRIISKYKGIVKYDKETQTPNAKINLKDTQNLWINGNKLESGTYMFYYENEESMKQKLALVNEYDLLGAGVWALGQENTDIWQYYKNELNAIPYVSEEIQDVQETYEALILNIERKLEMELKAPSQESMDIDDIINKKNINEYVHLVEHQEEKVSYIKTEEKIIERKQKTKINMIKDIQQVFLKRIEQVGPN